MVPLLVLFAVAVFLAVASLATAEPPAAPLPDRDGYFDRWQALHGDHDPRVGSVWLRGRLTLVYQLARPLSRLGVQPDVLTAWSAWLAVAVFVPAAVGGRWLLLAAFVLVVSGLTDTLDGCVAALTDRASRWGYVLDSAVDRVNDVVYLVALVAVGAPSGIAVVGGLAFLLLEYVRARANNAGAGEVRVVTIGERGVRVALCGAGLFFAGLFPAEARLIVTLALIVLTALSLVGLAQLVVAIRRDLTTPL